MSRTVLVILASWLVLSSFAAETLECRQYSGHCDSCLADPNCGYCGVTEACVPGTYSGPNVGNCSSWEFESCGQPGPTPAPSTPTPSPGSLTNVWGTYGGDNSRTSYAPVTFGTLNNKSVTIAQNIHCATSPVTSEEYVFCMSGANVIAVSLSTGSLVWNTSVASSYSQLSPPFYDPQTRKVVVQVNLADEGTLITALEVDTGLLNWTYQDNSQWPILPYGLVAHDGLVYAPVGSQTSFVVALRLSDGQMVWREEGYNADAGCDQWGPTIAVINGSAQVLWNKETGESYPTMVGALDAKTGAALWSVSYAESWQGYSAYWYPVYSGEGLVLISPWGYSSPTSFTLLDISSSNHPTELWQFNVSQRSKGSAVANGVAYVLSGSQIVALSLATGSVQAMYSAEPVAAPFIVTDDALFAQSLNNNNCMVQFSLDTKALVGTYCSNSPVNGIALAAKDKKLVIAGSSNIYIVSSSS